MDHLAELDALQTAAGGALSGGTTGAQNVEIAWVAGALSAQDDGVKLLATAKTSQDTGTPFPQPRNLDELRADPYFLESSADAVVAAVPFRAAAEAAA